MARCQGHSSFISCIAFDVPRCVNGRVYRFGSVGEDGRLLLVRLPPHTSSYAFAETAVQWDFSSTALLRPRHHANHSSSLSQNNLHMVRSGLASTVSLAKDAHIGGMGVGMTPNGVNSHGEAQYHPAPPRSEVPILESVVVCMQPLSCSSSESLPNAGKANRHRHSFTPSLPQPDGPHLFQKCSYQELGAPSCSGCCRSW